MYDGAGILAGRPFSSQVYVNLRFVSDRNSHVVAMLSVESRGRSICSYLPADMVGHVS